MLAYYETGTTSPLTQLPRSLPAGSLTPIPRHGSGVVGALCAMSPPAPAPAPAASAEAAKLRADSGNESAIAADPAKQQLTEATAVSVDLPGEAPPTDSARTKRLTASAPSATEVGKAEAGESADLIPQRPQPVTHLSTPAYDSPLRHHRRTPSTPRQVIETLHARSEYTNSEDDGTAVHRINQYVIKQEIGRGSFGAVHLAVDQHGKEYVRLQIRRVLRRG